MGDWTNPGNAPNGTFGGNVPGGETYTGGFGSSGGPSMPGWTPPNFSTGQGGSYAGQGTGGTYWPSTSTPATSSSPAVNPLDAIYGLAYAQYAPQQAALEYQRQLGLGTGLAKDAYLSNFSALDQASYNNALAGLGIQQQSIGTDRNRYGANLGLYNQLIDMTKALGPLNQSDLANNLAKIGLAQTQQSQDLKSRSIAGGAMFAPGVGIGQNQIAQAAGIARTGANINAQQADNSIGQAVIGHEIRRNLQQADLDHLDQKAQQLGIDSNTLYLNLQRGLASTGLDRMMNVQSIMSMSRSADAQERVLGDQLMQEVLTRGQQQGVTPEQTWDFTNKMGPGGSTAGGGSWSGVLNPTPHQGRR